jgi:hypothetical protein
LAPYEGIVYPDDLADLCKLFHEVCAARGVVPDSSDGELVAKQLVVLYQAGMCRRDDVLVAFAAKKAA